MHGLTYVWEHVAQLDILVRHVIRSNGDDKTWCGRQPDEDQDVWFADHDRGDVEVICPRCKNGPRVYVLAIRTPPGATLPPQQDLGSLAIAIEELTDTWFQSGTHVTVEVG